PPSAWSCRVKMPQLKRKRSRSRTPQRNAFVKLLPTERRNSHGCKQRPPRRQRNVLRLHKQTARPIARKPRSNRAQLNNRARQLSTQRKVSNPPSAPLVDPRPLVLRPRLHARPPAQKRPAQQAVRPPQRDAPFAQICKEA